jgi:hypothetical protein
MGSAAEDACQRLASFGTYLYRSLFPPELQDAMRQLSGLSKVPALLIQTDRDAWLPWEIVHDGRSFLSEKFIVGRWLNDLDEARPYEFPVGAVHVAYYANVEQPEAWATLLEPNRAPPPHILSGGTFDTLNILESMRGLHLIRYGKSQDGFDRRDTPVLSAQFNDSETIDTDVHPAKLNLRRNRPLVGLSYVSNGLHELTMADQTWASTFIRARCSAFISALWAVEQQVEEAFVSTFYYHLWAGESLGGAFAIAREMAHSVAPDSLDWLAYVLFGDPMARPYRPVQGQGYAAVEPVGRNLDDPIAPRTPARFRVSLRRTPPVWHEDRVIEVTEELDFAQLQVHIVSSGLEVMSGSPITMNKLPSGDYLGWLTLIAPDDVAGMAPIIQLYFADGSQPIHSLTFSLPVQDGKGGEQ